MIATGCILALAIGLVVAWVVAVTVDASGPEL
jgi:hypothetical protein